jgi:glycosyltransferase involved in cell wall biosynthesis
VSQGTGDGLADLPTVSVIIPVRNGADLLRSCLAALLLQTYPAELVEVVIVDNASTEDLRPAMPADPRVRLLHEARPGSYAARNTGLAAATGTVLAFTDGDCVPDPAWLTEAVSVLRAQPRADMVGGAVTMFFRGPEPASGPELYEARHGFPQESYLRDQQFAVTANMLTWRDVVDRVGGFDGSLVSRGDADFGHRVAAAGLLQRYAPDAVVRHPARATWREVRDKTIRVSRGRRDVDSRDGLGRGHLWRLAGEQVYLAARKTAGVAFFGKPPHGILPSARYLAVYNAARAVQLWVYGSAAVRPTRVAR